ncbi:MAG: hypothetical protein D3922_07950 [Candidatus Electrothrix sp. AR1]|nr:hypothetical protein [Candidatus Electrothrix sp. AR1]
MKPTFTEIKIYPIKEDNGVRIDMPIPLLMHIWSFVLPVGFFIFGLLFIISDHNFISIGGLGCITFIALNHLFTLFFFQARRITVMPERICIKYGPYYLRRVTVPFKDFGGIQLEQVLLTGPYVYYDIYVQCGKKKYRLAHNLKDQAEAKWVKYELQRACRQLGGIGTMHES